ncbi:MAG: hypothetical protein J5J06_04670 [Phycisphaerae bacterium]|nr:hypothetical protein [Phycisphaerae bacterium]
MSAAPTDRMDTSCACGARFRVPTSAVGKKAKCPKCGVVFTIQAGEMAQAPSLNANVKLPPKPKPAAPASVEASSGSDADSLLDDLAQMERQAPAVGGSTPAALCVKCGQALAPGAKACMNCGYNSATGKTVRAASARQVKVAKAMSERGRFALGVTLSGVAALVSALIWFTIAKATLSEFGLLAWAVGLACGLGMLKGWGKESPIGGLIAAAMSTGGIVLAKALIFGLIVYASLTGNTDDIKIQRLVVADRLTQQRLEEEGVYDDEEWDKRYDELYPQMEIRAQAMSDGKVREMIQELRDENAGGKALEGETGAKRSRLASFQAQKSATLALAMPLDRSWAETYKKQVLELGSLAEAELDTRIREMEAWEASGKWNDEEYIRAACITELASKELREDTDRFDFSAPVEQRSKIWAEWVEKGTAECQEKSHEERVAFLREIERKDERDGKIGHLALHRAGQRANQAGLPPESDTRDEYYEEEESKLADVDDATLDREIAALDAWEKEHRWNDEQYVHSLVAYHFARVESSERLEPRWEDDDDENDELTDEEWAEVYQAGVRRADSLGPEERLTLAHKIDSGEIWREQMEQESGGQVTAAAVGLFSAFFQSMFQPIDLLFFGLAIFTAYKIGAKGTAEDN